MCGIAGILNPLKNDNLTQEFVEKAECVLKNRGPNHFGRFQRERITLLHSRLRIIDLTDGANQPMISRSGNSAIVFNGEIFNYKDLQKQISTRRTNSDTEVILELYEKRGAEETLKLLHGQFAFCIADFKAQKLVFARDRFGQAPLYYTQTNGFAFSSDIRLLSQVFSGRLTLNENSIRFFLIEISTPQPYSVWNEVHQLEPAHYMEVDFDGKITLNKKYWELGHTYTELTESATVKKTEELLDKAIVRRLVSDVPVGCFLSGGIDSGLIVAMLASRLTAPVKTFSVGFDYEEYNELPDAAIIAKKYGTEHHSFELAVDVLSDLEKILECYGEPFGDSSAIPTYYISREIKKHVSVALSGDGGDELFGGYLNYGDSYSAEEFAVKYSNKIQRQIVSTASKLGSRITGKIQNRGSEKEYLDKSPVLRLYRNMGFHPDDEIIQIGDRRFVNDHLSKIWNDELHRSSTRTLMRASLKTRLLNDYLVKVDRAAMDNSLEVRCPFLDHELADFAFSIPPELMFKNHQLKYVLKKLGEKYMYTDIFSRKKRGFGIPVSKWLRSELYDFTRMHLNDLVKRDFVIKKDVLRLLEEHKKERHQHTDRLWLLLCLELWMKNNL